MVSTEAHKRAVLKHAAANVTRLNLNLNHNTDADILQWLADVEAAGHSRQGAIKEALRKYISAEKPAK